MVRGRTWLKFLGSFHDDVKADFDLPPRFDLAHAGQMKRNHLRDAVWDLLAADEQSHFVIGHSGGLNIHTCVPGNDRGCTFDLRKVLHAGVLVRLTHALPPLQIRTL